jgi:transcriptional regulator with XRE-family HTH domain
MSEPVTKIQKQTFAAYIAQKRKEAGLTQEELAKRLYVTHSTVSKWERGLSYPDIALVSDVCRELSISEHEFFTACDDVAMCREKQEASAYRKLLLRWKNTFLGCYAVTIVVCFICNLAIGHGLDWFWIVLTSLMLAFSFTNVPLMVKKERGVLCLGAATVSLFLLLLVCWWYTRGPWNGFGTAVTAVSYLPVWCIFAVAAYVPLHGCLKAGLICLISDFTIPFLDITLSSLLLQPAHFGWSVFFDWSRIFRLDPEGMWINVLLFAIGLIGGLTVTAVGIVLQIRRQKMRDAVS